ncbi:hypothetical protein AN217_15865 [Streptomyces qinglanensis]|uniref:Uncharacterized protein n=1 Tax=Streptomyces qinglanensis TaxID=943816 RepID=A0A1E7K532_9ACTN|nr:hypothetical protein [Streptomyces qinglanensis]OEU99042.1 hypothetical protein AN217_15865 [Streptomyces qinglanensis]
MSTSSGPGPLPPPELRPGPGARARDVAARCWAALHERAPRDSRAAVLRVSAGITRGSAERTRR